MVRVMVASCTDFGRGRSGSGVEIEVSICLLVVLVSPNFAGAKRKGGGEGLGRAGESPDRSCWVAAVDKLRLGFCNVRGGKGQKEGGKGKLSDLSSSPRAACPPPASLVALTKEKKRIRVSCSVPSILEKEVKKEELWSYYPPTPQPHGQMSPSSFPRQKRGRHTSCDNGKREEEEEEEGLLWVCLLSLSFANAVCINLDRNGGRVPFVVGGTNLRKVTPYGKGRSAVQEMASFGTWGHPSPPPTSQLKVNSRILVDGRSTEEDSTSQYKYLLYSGSH